MSQDKSFDQVPSADHLRGQLTEAQRKRAQADSLKFDARADELMNFANDFLSRGVTEEEIAKVRRVIDAAVKDGKYEAMVYSFPSSLCTDNGRAINNAEKGWPTTLQGKAKEFYERYEALGRPAGFKLKAMIISFPNGVPGDVGLFLNWEDDKY